MIKFKGVILMCGVLAAFVSTGALAFPGSSNAVQIDRSGITLVAGGCGIGWHRNLYGYCVRNGTYAAPPAYILAPAPRVCPYPYRLNAYGQCVAW